MNHQLNEGFLNAFEKDDKNQRVKKRVFILPKKDLFLVIILLCLLIFLWKFYSVFYLNITITLKLLAN